MKKHYYIACDLGADSGRVILGCLEEGKLNLQEIHRFPNGPVRIQGSLRWNVLRIFEELKAGLRKVAERNVPVESVSVDSWGSDYVLYNQRQAMLCLPFHYRDERTAEQYQVACKDLREKIFMETGIQFLPFNTLYQLLTDAKENADLLALADQFLTIADYFHYLFCGVARIEETMASTTQIYSPTTRQWACDLIRSFGLPERIFPEIAPPGSKLGILLPEIQQETGLADIPVCATCSHDTGAAVAAVPACGRDWAFLSSGTWSLIGVELQAPLINEEARKYNFTNEAGYGGSTRFLKNVSGLWLLQESRREWIRRGQVLSFEELDRLAEEAEPFRSLIDPNADRFMAPGNMLDKIAAFCRETRQPAPETPGQVVRCIFESLALSYGQMLGRLESLTRSPIARLHIVGGGSQSGVLNQFAANGTRRIVLAGPVEATACGNILVQALALGHLGSLEEVRAVVRNSVSIKTYQPRDCDEWTRAFENFTSRISPD